MENRNYQIVNLRVLAIVSVVLGHSCIIYSDGWTTYSTIYYSAFFRVLKEVINGFQMHLFFSVSGFLFYHSYKKSNLPELLKKKGSRLIVPFLLTGLFWLVPVRYLAHYPLYDGNLVNGFRSFFCGDWGHLWFLPTLFVIFLIAFLLLRMCEKVGLDEKMSLWFVTGGAFVMMFVAKKMPIPTILTNVLYWFFFFMLGYVFCKIGYGYHSLLREKGGWGVFWLLVMTFMVLYVLRIVLGNSVMNLFSSIFCIFFLYQVLCLKRNRFMDFLDDYSMGIYLFHSPVIYLLYYHFANTLPPIYLVTLNMFVSIGCSIFLTDLLRRLRLSFVLGE